MSKIKPFFCIETWGCSVCFSTWGCFSAFIEGGFSSSWIGLSFFTLFSSSFCGSSFASSLNEHVEQLKFRVCQNKILYIPFWARIRWRRISARWGICACRGTRGVSASRGFCWRNFIITFYSIHPFRRNRRRWKNRGYRTRI